MSRLSSLLLAAVAMGAMGAAAADAAPGYATTAVNVRAGPGTQYPAVDVLTPGQPVEIYGCLAGWSWCDVAYNGGYYNSGRGWVAGAYLQVIYSNGRYPIGTYGGFVGIPFTGFDVGTYWGQNYRNRSFYGQLPSFNGPPNRSGPPSFNGPPPPPPPFQGPSYGYPFQGGGGGNGGGAGGGQGGGAGGNGGGAGGGQGGGAGGNGGGPGGGKGGANGGAGGGYGGGAGGGYGVPGNPYGSAQGLSCPPGTHYQNGACF